LDAGNVKMTFNALLEKADSKEKERLKEEQKKVKRMENNFRQMLAEDGSIGEGSKWEEVRAKFEGKPSFEEVPSEEERVRLFQEYIRDMEEACSHSHGASKASKKSKKKKRRRTPSTSSEDSSDSHQRSRSRGRKGGKKSKRASREEESDVSSDEEESGRSSKKKKSKNKER